MAGSEQSSVEEPFLGHQDRSHYYSLSRQSVESITTVQHSHTRWRLVTLIIVYGPAVALFALSLLNFAQTNGQTRCTHPELVPCTAFTSDL